VPYEKCGKLIVATTEEELPPLRTLHERGTANGTRLEMPARARPRDRAARPAVAALYPAHRHRDYERWPRYGLPASRPRVDVVTARRSDRLDLQGGLLVETAGPGFRTRNLVNCADSTRIASRG